MSLSWDALAAEIHAGQKFLLTSHVRPDCDALGSELGLAAILDALGKESIILNADATPGNIAFVDPLRRIKVLAKDVAPDAIPQAFPDGLPCNRRIQCLDELAQQHQKLQQCAWAFPY